ncbi:MAG: acyltransferase domain-containing protein [Tistlia sp.]|uniref:acyltransferase domain-containing protein n=1 Tax=Tistlia sp. TaxID=3057121 RepID=UPI0034A179BF
MKPVVWMFSGQGSQYFGMARDLYESEPVFRRTLETCGEILAPRLGLRLDEEIYRQRPDRFAPFERTRHSSPAILAVQLGVARLLQARGQRPDLLLGYSLGELTAGVVAGTLGLEDVLDLTVRMAEALEERAPPGAMLAVLAEAALVERRPDWFAGTWIAARNFPGHFVVSGGVPEIERLQARLSEAQVTFQQLPVEFAYHSPLIEPAGEATRAALAAMATVPGGIEVVSASDGRTTGAPSAEVLWRTFSGPVGFDLALPVLEARGPFRYLDLGPSGTLGTFVKYALAPGSQSEVAMTVTPFGTSRQNLERLLGAR